MVNDKKLKELMKGKTKRLNGDEILFIIEQFPGMKKSTYTKLSKAYNSGCGCNFTLSEDEMAGSGFMKSVGRVGKSLGKAAMRSGIGDMVINEAVGALPIGQTAQNAISKGLRNEAHHLAGAGFLKSVGKVGKSLGKAAVKSGVTDMLIDEGLKQSGLNPELSGKIGKLGKNVSRDLAGAGFLKSVGKVGKSLGKAAVKSGVTDMLIDEGLKQSGLNPELSGKIGKLGKNVSRDLVGGSMNPYLPDELRGKGIGQPRVYNTLSNRVHSGSDSFMVNPHLLPAYDQYKAMKGRGFIVH